MPPAVVEGFNAILREVLARPEIRQSFEGYGRAAIASSSAELGAMIGQEVPKWRAIIEAAGIRVQ